MKLGIILIGLVLALVSIKAVFASEHQPEGSGLVSSGQTHKYLGVKKCAMCHKSESKGNQYGKWLSSEHAKAYEILVTPQAQATAKKAGISGNPQQAVACLKCHVTANGVESSLLGEGFVKEDGVQCESCHGAGGDYASLSAMKDKDKAIGAGLVMPTEEVCVRCHNTDSPNFNGFNFKEYYPKIAHPVSK